MGGVGRGGGGQGGLVGLVGRLDKEVYKSSCTTLKAQCKLLNVS